LEFLDRWSLAFFGTKDGIAMRALGTGASPFFSLFWVKGILFSYRFFWMDCVSFFLFAYSFWCDDFLSHFMVCLAIFGF
jgi:hypothetical protein